VLVLDMSGSMGREQRSQHFRDSLRWLVKSGTKRDRLGIVSFGRRARVEQELRYLGNFQYDKFVAGFKGKAQPTNLAAGLEQAYYLLKDKGRPKVNQWILLISDGKISIPGGKKAIERSRHYLLTGLIPALAKARIRLFAVVPKGYSADFLLLQQLATKTEGDYFRGLPKNFSALHLPLPDPPRTKTKKKEHTPKKAPAKKPQAITKVTTSPPPAPRPQQMPTMVKLAIALVVAMVCALLFFAVRRRPGASRHDLRSILGEIQTLRQEIIEEAELVPAFAGTDSWAALAGEAGPEPAAFTKEVSEEISVQERPLSLYEAIGLMSSAGHRDELLLALARGMRRYLEGVKIFVLKEGKLQGYLELGAGQDRGPGVSDLEFSLPGASSVVSRVFEEGSLVFSPIPEDDPFQETISAAGIAGDKSTVLVPVQINGRTICLVLGYGFDQETSPQLEGHLSQLATTASAVLRSLILRNKKPTPGGDNN